MPTLLHRDESLGARSDDRKRRAFRVFQLQEVEVGARVEMPQHTVHVKRIRRTLLVKPLRWHHLKYITVDDVFLRTTNRTLERLTARHPNRVSRCAAVDHPERRGCCRGKRCLQGIESSLRILPLLISGGSFSLTERCIIQHVRKEHHGPLAMIDHDKF